MRSHPLRNVLSVVVTEHDPATGTTTHTTWRIDLRTAPRNMAGPLRNAVLTAIPTLAATAQDLPALAARVAAAVDADLDGYASSSSHVGGNSSAVADSVTATVEQRLADDRQEAVRIVERNLDTAIAAANALTGAMWRLGKM